MNSNAVAAAGVVVAMAALLVLGPSEVVSPVDDVGSPLPMADAADALTASWFCPSAQGGSGATLTTEIDVANTAATAREGTVTWYTAADGTATTRSFTVAAGAVIRLRATATGPTPAASALVETSGAGVVVEQVVTGARGSAASPCASDTSREWYLANGTTLVDATEVLALFNPFPGDAVVDIEFATEVGREAPGGVQGVVIPAGATTFVDVGATVRRQEVTAAAVRARTGRLVVGRLQSFDGTQGRTGQSLALAARSPAEVWSFADGSNAPGLTLSWHVFNPGTREAEVSIEVMPVSGDTPEPIDVTVPPRSQVVVHGVREGGVASGVSFASTVRSINGVPVVAEGAFDLRLPDGHRGWSSTLGSPAPARRWAFAHGDTSASGDEWVAIFNPGAQPQTFSVDALLPGGRTPLVTLQELVVPPASRILLRLADHIGAPQVGFVIVAEGPVVVNRWIFGVGRPGTAFVAGIPFEAG